MGNIMAVEFLPGQQCDRCTAMALVGYGSPELDLSLALCGHHSRKQDEALRAAGFAEVVDLFPSAPRLRARREENVTAATA